MTANTPLNHKIWQLAWPMIIANLSVPLLGLVDTAILGHLGSAQYLAAVAVGNSILSFLYWGFGFLRMGTTGLTAQALGAKDHYRLRLVIAQAMVLGLTIGIIVLSLSSALITIGLQWVEPPAGAETLAQQYCQLRIFSAPATLITFAIIGWLIGHQNTRWPLVITLTTNIINIGLDFLLIIGLDMNSNGAALATLIAEYAGCGLALAVLRRQLAPIPAKLDRSTLWRWADYQQLLRANRHLFVRTIALLAGFAFFTAQGAAIGEITLAANTILLQLLLAAAFGLDGFAHAAEALVGDAVGKRDRELFTLTWRQCGKWSLLTAAIFTGLYGLFGPQLLGLMSSLEAVHAASLEYLPWLVLMPMIAATSYLLDGIFIGSTQTAAMQTTMLLAIGLVYLPAWYFTRGWGNHGLWLAFLLFNGSRGAFLYFYFRRYQHPWRWW